MDRFQLRRDSLTRWTEVNPLLLNGEIGLEIDTRKFKIGDGIHNWNDLEYAMGISQEKGSSTNLTMSQKATTDLFNSLLQNQIFSLIRQTNEDGFFIVDTNGYIGFEVNNTEIKPN